MQNTMRINAPKGTAVKVITDDNGKVINGNTYDQLAVSEYLEVNKIYHVLKTEISNWSTKVFFTELGVSFGFNSACFYEV